MFTQEDNAIIWKKGYETLRIEGWGADSLRVRCTMNAAFSGEDWALSEKPAAVKPAVSKPAASTVSTKPSVTVSDEEAEIKNGKLSATVSANGVLRFYRDGKLILREYYRNYDGKASRESVCLKVVSREFHPVIGGSEFKLTVRFDANEGEQIFGMGQYQQPNLDMKGCVLELAQRNSQSTIPFYLSSLGYGFLWNNPSVGRATFGTNRTVWESSCCDEMDYWITAADSPAAIMRNYP
ncbi:MAG: family 31 glucosidase, partial [Treponema sp.]|nr:family 31 glucosidase [Treponema sp.]